MASDVKNNWSIALGYSVPPVIPVKNLDLVSDTNPFNRQMTKDENYISNGRNHKLTIGESNYATQMKFSSSSFKDVQLPCDPVVSVSLRNIVTRRQVCKGVEYGTIKERWAKDDYEVNIAGVLIADSRSVADKIKVVREICEAHEAVAVSEATLNEVYGINNLSIDGVDFPFTEGLDNQRFTIHAHSDTSYSLIIEARNDV